MDLRDYVRAIATRWAWVLTAGLVGLVTGACVGVLSPAGHQSGIALYVDASLVSDPQDPSSAAEIRTTVLPSVAALVRSRAVLDEVAAELGLADSASALAGDVEVVTDQDTSVIRVTAARPTAAGASALAVALGAEVRQQAEELFPGTQGSLLRVTPIRTSAAAVPTARSAATLAVLGAAAATGLAGVAAGLAELRRPRIRGRGDVARTTSAPALALLPAAGPVTGRAGRRRAHPDRSALVDRLRTVLRGDGDGDRRVLLVGVSAPATALAGELRAPGLATVAVADPREPVDGRVDGRVDEIVLVADGRRSTARELAAAAESAAATGTPVTGVVVDAVLPRGARWSARWRAGMAGSAQEWLESRSTGDQPGPRHAVTVATQVAAAAAVAAVGFTYALPLGLTGSMVVAGALLPVWLPLVLRYRGLLLLLVLAGVGLASGALLAWLYSDDHGFVLHEAAVHVSLATGAVCGVGVLLWARELLSTAAVGVSFGAAMLATELLQSSGSDNVWKFQLSAPLMVIGLALASRRDRPLPAVAVLGVLALANVTNDARSAFGFCVLAACLVLWQARRPSGAQWRAQRRAPRVVVLGLLAVLGAAGYWLLTKLILAGALGADFQRRTAVQIEQTGSLLLGGRPEWTVTRALMEVHPFGFGLGIVPNGEDVAVGAAGIATTNIPTAEAYLRNYLLEGGVELHSIAADLWAALGPAGLLLGVAMGVLVAAGFADRFGRREASPLACLLLPIALWNLAFGPLESNVDTLTLALGLLLVARPPRRDAAGRSEQQGLPVPTAAATGSPTARPAVGSTA